MSFGTLVKLRLLDLSVLVFFCIVNSLFSNRAINVCTASKLSCNLVLLIENAGVSI